jgi:hypothetical protein
MVNCRCRGKQLLLRPKYIEKDAKKLFFTPPSMGLGTTDGFELKIEAEMTIGKR